MCTEGYIVDDKYLFQMGLSTLGKHYSSSSDDCQLSGNKEIYYIIKVVL